MLEGEGVRSGKFQSGCRAVTGDVKRLGGGYWRLETRLGAGVGVWECLWGRVRAGLLGGGRGTPPPPSSDSLGRGGGAVCVCVCVCVGPPPPGGAEVLKGALGSVAKRRRSPGARRGIAPPGATRPGTGPRPRGPSGTPPSRT